MPIDFTKYPLSIPAQRSYATCPPNYFESFSRIGGSGRLGEDSSLRSTSFTSRRTLKPFQIHELKSEAKRMFFIGKLPSSETILAIVFEDSIEFLSVTFNADWTESSGSNVPYYTIKLKQTLQLPPGVRNVQNVCIDQSSCLSLPTYRLVYAISHPNGQEVFFIKTEGDEDFPSEVDLEKANNLMHGAPVTHMALYNDKKLLCCAVSEPKFFVWYFEDKNDSDFESVWRKRIKSTVADVAWDYTESCKLVVLQTNGWLTMYNARSKYELMRLYVYHQPIICAQFSQLSQTILFTTPGKILSLDPSKLNVKTSKPKQYESPLVCVRSVCCHPLDSKLFLTVSSTQNEVSVWSHTFSRPIWTLKENVILDAAWIQDKPNVILLNQKKLLFFGTPTPLK